MPRDRIFSLLSICGEDTDVKVDYNLPEEEVMFQTLGSSKAQLCLCSATTVARALDLQYNARLQSNLLQSALVSRPYIEIDVHADFVRPNSWCVLYSEEYHQPRVYLGEGPGMTFNTWKACPTKKSFRWYWFQPSNARESQTVWSEPFRACNNSQLIPVCQYGNGFSVVKKHGVQRISPPIPQEEVSDRSRLSTGANDLDTVRWNFDHSQTLAFHGGGMSFYGLEPEKPRLLDECIDTLDVYTIRMTFPVLTKIMMEHLTWNTAHCDFKRDGFSKGGFEYPRIGHEYRAGTE